MARVGVLGGTFNPPHVGHLVCAQAAREELGLDRVLLMPVFRPPHKDAHDDPGPAARLDLCRLAAAGEESVEVSDLEIERGGASYTVDTLRELHRRAPDDELVFIAGGDMAHALPAWRDPEGILALATFAVAEREGVGREDIRARLAGLRGAQERVVFFDMPRLDLSSSLLRRRIAAGRSVRHLVPDAVRERIADRGWYRQSLP